MTQRNKWIGTLAGVGLAALAAGGCASSSPTAFRAETGPTYRGTETLPTQVSGWNLGAADMLGWQVFASREVRTAYLDIPDFDQFDSTPTRFAGVETDEVD